ncbi:hypothetical protein GCM10020218_096830 [Dactylosporangium vinaceum]
MSVSTGTSTLCRRCGQAAPGAPGRCTYCGSPLNRAAAFPVRGPAAAIAPAIPMARTPYEGPVHRFEPARLDAGGPGLSRRTRRLLGAGAAGAILAVAALIVLRPAPPSPAGAVRDYFDHLAAGDTAAALALVDSGESYTPRAAPLLVAAALADPANRPGGLTVTATEEPERGGPYSTVTATYKLGGQTVEQLFAVVATPDEQPPYRLERPFLTLTAQVPVGLATTVNGVAVDGAALARGTPAFPGVYTGTTSGNALFAGGTRAATVRSDGQGARADIAFGAPAVAPGAPKAVQTAVEEYLDRYCINGPVTSQCPLRGAPYKAYGQKTTWAITTYPQVQLTPDSSGRVQVAFATATEGSAAYTVTWSDSSGAPQTATGTVPVTTRGYASLGNDGTITISLGY